MDMSLTKLPLENGKGEPLQVCSECYGGGIARIAVDAYTTRTGRLFRIGQALTEPDAKLFQKEKWKFTCGRCEDCNGAGMVKVGGSDA